MSVEATEATLTIGRDEAAQRLATLLETIDPMYLRYDAEQTYDHAVDIAHWVHTTWRDLTPLQQSRYSFETGAYDVLPTGQVGSIARDRSRRPDFVDLHRKVSVLTADEPEARSLIMTARGLTFGSRLSKAAVAASLQTGKALFAE